MIDFVHMYQVYTTLIVDSYNKLKNNNTEKYHNLLDTINNIHVYPKQNNVFIYSTIIHLNFKKLTKVENKLKEIYNHINNYNLRGNFICITNIELTQIYVVFDNEEIYDAFMKDKYKFI